MKYALKAIAAKELINNSVNMERRKLCMKKRQNYSCNNNYFRHFLHNLVNKVDL